MTDNEGATTDNDFEESSLKPRHAGRRLTSVVWDHFTVIDRKNQIAVCNTCDKKLSFKTTVTNLKKHIIRKHPYGGYAQDNSTSTNTPRPTVSAKSARERLFFQDTKRQFHRETKPFDIRKSRLTELGGLEGLVLNVIGEDGENENLILANEENEEENYTEEAHEYTVPERNQAEKSNGKDYTGSKFQQRTHSDASERKRKSRIMDLQLECLEIKKYSMQLESLMLEQQLNIRRSIFTEPLQYADMMSRGTQTEVGGENTRVFYLTDEKGGMPTRHLFAMQDFD